MENNASHSLLTQGVISIGSIRRLKRRYVRYTVYRRFLRIGMILTGFVLIVIGILTFYGQNAGNFVMTVSPESYDRKIAISDDPTFNWYSSRLFASPIQNALDMTYSWLKIQQVLATNGNFIDPHYKYVGYTFYLKNMGDETIAVDMRLDITDVFKKLDEAIRVLVIEDDTISNLYQKPDTVPPDIPYEKAGLPPAKHFINATRVCGQRINNFRPNQMRKFSVLIWLEGNDPDCVNEKVLGSMIKMEMLFEIVGVGG